MASSTSIRINRFLGNSVFSLLVFSIQSSVFADFFGVLVDFSLESDGRGVVVSMLQLRQIRGDAGLSQQALAKMVGVRQTTISSWETGATSPDAEQLWNLAVALGCTPNDLLGWVDDVPPVVSTYNQLDAGNRATVDDVARGLLVAQQVDEIKASSAARRSA